MEGNRGNQPGQSLAALRLSVEEWRHRVSTFRGHFISIIQPLQVFLKAKLNTDPEGRVLQEELQNMGERNIEAAEKLLSFLLKEDHRTEADIAARWQLFGDVLKEDHPVLHQIITGQCQGDIQTKQKACINYYTDKITADVDPHIILPSLIANNLIGQVEYEHVQSIYETRGSTRSALYMVGNIHRINPDWYNIFLGVLYEHGYLELVKIVDPDVYHKKVEQVSTAGHFTDTHNGPEEAVANDQGAAYVPVQESNQLNPQRSREISPLGCDVSDVTPEHTGMDSAHRRGSDANSDSEGEEDFHSYSSSAEEDDFHSYSSSPDPSFNIDLELTKVKTVMACTNRSQTPQDETRAGLTGRDMGVDKADKSKKNPDNCNADVDRPARGEERCEPRKAKMQLYPDQVELAQDGLDGKNVIIVSPTGSGKTYVALHIIKNHLEQEGPGVRRVVFLVNNRALAEQQYRQYFLKYLSNFRITPIVGGDGATAPLNQLLKSADIFVMTAQILLNALEQKEINGIHEFSLVVFDECHHTQLKHTYNRIMHHYMALKFQGKDGSADVRSPRPPVQVVGLTASVGLGNARTPTEAEEHVMKLCAHLDTEHISTVQENLEQLHSRTNKPVHQHAECGSRPNDKFQAMIGEIMTKIEDRIEHSEYVDSDGTGGLQARMRQKPHQRGSCQYTTWISELLRTVTLLSDGQACRALKPCCDMLKTYNDSLIINDECDTEDALKFLDQQMSDYDPTGQRNTQTDHFLRDLFETNKPNLTVVSKEQAETNPKLIVIEEKLIKTFEETADSRAVLLVQTREQADIMLRWLRRRPWLHRLNVKPEKMVGACASADKGGMTDTQQKDVLDNFRDGRYNVLVATSIAEEGLHFPSCNLVTLVNHVTNEIAFMQARGRARAENSEFFIVAGENKGVQQKARDLDIGEMMMHEAVRQVQALGKQNHEQFLQQLYQIQEREKKERDAELTLRRNRHLEQGEVEFHCVTCDKFAFRSSDVRRIDNAHYVVIDLDYRHRHTERMDPPQLLGRIQNIGRLYCNGCEEYWGPILVYRKLKFPCVKLEGFRYTNASGEKKVAKKWVKTKLVVEEMTDDELDQFRKKAVEIGYVF